MCIPYSSILDIVERSAIILYFTGIFVFVMKVHFNMPHAALALLILSSIASVWLLPSVIKRHSISPLLTHFMEFSGGGSVLM